MERLRINCNNHFKRWRSKVVYFVNFISVFESVLILLSGPVQEGAKPFPERALLGRERDGIGRKGTRRRREKVSPRATQQKVIFYNCHFLAPETKSIKGHLANKKETISENICANLSLSNVRPTSESTISSPT